MSVSYLAAHSGLPVLYWAALLLRVFVWVLLQKMGQKFVTPFQ